MKRIYTTGNQPENPIITDVVTYIYDIRREPDIEPETEEGEPIAQWSYLPGEVLSLSEWKKRVIDEIKDLSEAIMELDGGNEA